MSESQLFDFCDRVGIDAEDFSEVWDKAIIVATRADIKIQSLVRNQGRRQAHNADVVHVFAAAFLLLWYMNDAAFEWGWDTDEYDGEEMMGDFLCKALDFIQAHRIPLREREDEDGDSGE